MNKDIMRLIDIYVKESKYSLYEFQQNILDEFDIESSICFGDNDEEEYIEIYTENDIIKINKEGDLI